MNGVVSFPKVPKVIKNVNVLYLPKGFVMRFWFQNVLPFVGSMELGCVNEGSGFPTLFRNSNMV